MHTNSIKVLCSGGHAKVVSNTLEELGILYSVYDEDQKLVGNKFLDTYIQSYKSSEIKGSQFHIALGNNTTREALYKTLEHDAFYISVISNKAIVSKYSTISIGCFVAPNTIVSADSIIGKGTIINHGAVCDHDSNIGNFCHIAPNATILGGVTIGDRVFIGAGAVILPNIVVHSDVIVAAGSVVTKNISSPCTVIGSPAKPKRNNCET